MSTNLFHEKLMQDLYANSATLADIYLGWIPTNAKLHGDLLKDVEVVKVQWLAINNIQGNVGKEMKAKAKSQMDKLMKSIIHKVKELQLFADNESPPRNNHQNVAGVPRIIYDAELGSYVKKYYRYDIVSGTWVEMAA